MGTEVFSLPEGGSLLVAGRTSQYQDARTFRLPEELSFLARAIDQGCQEGRPSAEQAQNL